MFGMGFTEILFIAVIAVLFLGPEKLPDAMVQIARFFKTIRGTINEAKSSFEEELRINELREEALNYRRKIEEASNDIHGFKNAIPNPAAELQDAITSIGGDRYLDDDLLADIHEAEQAEKETGKTTHEDDHASNASEDGTLEEDASVKNGAGTIASSERPTRFKHLAREDHG